MSDYISREAVIKLITARYENPEICAQEINRAMSDIISKLREAYKIGDVTDIMDLLSELFKQYDEGLVKVLPCKVGDTIWAIQRDFRGNARIQEEICTELHYNGSLMIETDRHITRLSWRELGKNVFLSCEAAEKALKERES